MDSPDPNSNAAEGIGVGAGSASFFTHALPASDATDSEHLYIRRAIAHSSSLEIVLDNRLVFYCLYRIVHHSPSDHTVLAL
jgi:hypothetical protein